jgi:hypothetical protein
MAKKLVVYDAAVIQEFAQRLYNQAASIIFTSTLFGVLIGGLLGLGFVVVTKSKDMGVVAIIGVVIGGLAGLAWGKERAFKLKFKAQKALCQVQIEKNTSVERK